MSSKKSDDKKGSPLNKLNAKVEKLRRGGSQIIGLHVGQPDEETPQFLIDSMPAALTNPISGQYTLVDGDWEVRKSLSRFVEMMFGFNYDPERIVVTSGAKQGLDAAIHAIMTDEIGKAKKKTGKKIMVIASDWPTYSTLINKHGGEVVLVSPNKDFSLPLSEIRKLIGQDVRAIIINSPNNPTGVVYCQEDMAELVRMAIKHDIYVISDEVYRAVVLDGAMCPSVADFPEMKDLAIVVNSFSKMWAIPGWRCGFVLAQDEMLCKFVTDYKSSCDGNSCSIMQFAIKEAIDSHHEESLEFIKACNAKYSKNAKLVCGRLEIYNIEYIAPRGALYVFAKLAGKFGVSSEKFADILLNKGVAVAPGSIFGEDCDGYIRICIAAKKEDIVVALEKIKELCGNRGRDLE